MTLRKRLIALSMAAACAATAFAGAAFTDQRPSNAATLLLA